MYHEVEEEAEVTNTREHLTSIGIGIAHLLRINSDVGDNHINKYLDPEMVETLDRIVQRLLKTAGEV